MNNIGDIRDCFEDIDYGHKRLYFWEIWNGKRWIGKAYSLRQANRVSEEFKRGLIIE